MIKVIHNGEKQEVLFANPEDIIHLIPTPAIGFKEGFHGIFPLEKYLSTYHKKHRIICFVSKVKLITQPKAEDYL